MGSFLGYILLTVYDCAELTDTKNADQGFSSYQKLAAQTKARHYAV